MSTRLSANVRPSLVWEEESVVGGITQTENNLSLPRSNWTYGSGSARTINAFYFNTVTLAAGDSLTIDFYSLQKPVLNYTLTQVWNKVKVLTIEQVTDSGSLDIGNSGLSNPLGLFGYDTNIGGNGIYEMTAEHGVPVNASARNIRILNRGAFSITANILAMGEK